MVKERKLIDIPEKYVYADFSDFAPITVEVRESNLSRTFTGGVRINNGMYRTEEETEVYIRMSLARALP